MATLDIPSGPVEAMETNRVTIGTWLRFLVGGREAIVRIAGSDQALWLGLVFVLSTGFAREYDGADLRSEPWHLALPLVASLGTSLMLWALMYVATRSRGLEQLGFWRGYRTLLTFYWMMAPMAWLYAIPVERFMTPFDAMSTNLWLLTGVSVWRVLLITRSISVWLGAPFFVIFFLVAFFADSVVVALAYVTPAPIFNIMGGVRMAPQDELLAAATFNVMVLGTLSWLAWIIAAIIAYLVGRAVWGPIASSRANCVVSKPLWTLSVILLLAGLALLPIGQPEQINASEASMLLKANDTAGAVAYMAKFPRDAFPPVWDPPPRIGYYEERPDVIDVLVEIERQNAPDWIAKLYIDKIAIAPDRALSDASPEQVDLILSVLENKIPVVLLDEMQIYGLNRIANDPKTALEQSKRLKVYLEDKWQP